MANQVAQKICKLQQLMESNQAWGKSYGVFSRIIKKYKLKIGIEVGVAFGGHAENLLTETKIDQLIGIDPYRYQNDYDDQMDLSQNYLDVIYNFTLQRLKKFGKRYKHLRMFSKTAASQVSKKIDFVYIDANHAYKSIQTDLAIWSSKVRKGGIIGGHDYLNKEFSHPGVNKAVDEFVKQHKVALNKHNSSVWWFIKDFE